MKKWFAFLLAVLVLISLVSCKKEEDSKETSPEKTQITEETSTDGEDSEKTENKPGGTYKISDGPRFDLPDTDVKRFQTFVTPFNVMPLPFDNVAALTNQSMIFTAAAALKSQFVPSADGTYSSVPLSKVETKIRDYFGSDAALTDGYLDQDYSPYSIDGDQLVLYSSGNIGGFFFPYALIKIEDGYELWLIDLMDPLFFDNTDNQDRLFSGEEISYSDIREIAPEMQYNIYHIREKDNRLTLVGFRFQNYKDINHFLF